MNLDFVNIGVQYNKKTGNVIVFPDFLVGRPKDLIVKGHAFYAVWNEETGLWSREEYTVQKLIDREIRDKAKEIPTEDTVVCQLLKNYSSKKWQEWQSYVKSLPDNFEELDTSITFSNSVVKKEDFVSKRLNYPLSEGPIECYNEIISTLYDPSERQKLEWAIGAIIKGDAKKIQKFIVLYGSAGTGKSTILNIIQMLFSGYCSVFEAKALASANKDFALEAFRSNPLVAIQHDGDLSKIEDNTKLNSLVSHEVMLVNEKFKTSYPMRFNAFLFMGTNKPVKITDAKSGIMRRLIDVTPSGRKLPFEKYNDLMSRVSFELGGIAYHCLKVYEELGISFYDSYKPILMMGATNDFYNFVEDSYSFFEENEEKGVGLRTAWLRYKEYCQDANVPYPYSMRVFKEELKNYFHEYFERYENQRNWYKGFRFDRFEMTPLGLERKEDEEEEKVPGWLYLDSEVSLLDEVLKDCKAQYAEHMISWDDVTTTLSDLDTTKTHYVMTPECYIYIDFDERDENGNKCLEKNIEEANKWPPTYAEVSNSGGGLHLTYRYEGDVRDLKRKYSEYIEIKTYPNDKKGTVRRRLSKCNSLSIATISSGLPLKEGGKVAYNYEGFENEQHLRNVINKNLDKKVHADTTSSIDFIYKLLEDAYESGMSYDVRDMRQSILLFAKKSTNQKDHCIKQVSRMHFISKDYEKKRTEEILSEYQNESFDDDAPLVIFDIEVFPNLLVICYKTIGEEKVHSLINPSPEECQKLAKFRLIGFNNRKYDNHILYARMQGKSLIEIYHISQHIISGDRDAFFAGAYNLSYTDIYDFSSKKQGLKKFEIELGIHHQELGLKWDKPVPKELWGKVVEYCCNDVVATEAVWFAREEDWACRQMLSELSGLSVNATNNSHSEQIVFEDDKNPQSQFVYTDLSKEFPGYQFNERGLPDDVYIKNEKGKPIKTSGKSVYMGEDPSEGGYAWSKPGMYKNVALLDIASMHPTTMIVLNIFGDKYTATVKALKDLRILVKHKEYDKAAKMFDGKLSKYLSSPDKAKALAGALKIVINAIYGLTAAHFKNRFRDPRNVDNIVAKRGALFMIKLKNEVISRGYTVVHCKTDSIKIADADPSIIQFVMDFGKQYGYDFEHEATYDKMCIVNKACYIARYKNEDGSLGDWTATADQFKVPYVFKSLFSHEKITFDDICETKSVTSSIYLDMNEHLPKLDPKEERTLAKLLKKQELTEDEEREVAWLSDKESKSHHYIFVGRVGSFCPIKAGCGGGELVRDQDGKMNAVEGTKGYRWLEAEPVRETVKDVRVIPDIIDVSYYERLVDQAVEDISRYGDFEWFTSDDPADPVEEPFVDGLEKDTFGEYMNVPEVA